MLKNISVFGFLKIGKLYSKTTYKIGVRKLELTSGLKELKQLKLFLPNNQLLIPILI